MQTSNDLSINKILSKTKSKKAAKKIEQKYWLLILLSLLAYIGGPALSDFIKNKTAAGVFVITVYAAVTCALAFIYFKTRKINKPAARRIRLNGNARFWAWAVSIMAFISVGLQTAMVIRLANPGFYKAFVRAAGTARGNMLQEPTLRTILTGLFVGLAAGICEEIIFRGFTLSAFLVHFRKTKRPLWAASLLSSILFAALHLINLTHQGVRDTLIQMLAAAALGMTYCVIRIASNNIFPTILLHGMQDFTAVNLLGTRATGLSTQPHGLAIQLSASIITIFVLSIALISIDKSLKQEKESAKNND